MPGSDGAVSVRLYDGLAQRGHAEGDTITGFENLRGSAHPDRLAGTGRANHLEGGAGNDQIRGGSGDDVLEGGAGADRLYGGNGADTASYTGSDAGVVVRLHNLSARGGHAEGDTFENTLGVTYTSTDGTTQTENLPDIENLTGSDHNDILAGDRRDNRLYGAAGDDILYGGPGGGDDLMDGGPGADKLYGGQGRRPVDRRCRCRPVERRRGSGLGLVRRVGFSCYGETLGGRSGGGSRPGGPRY